MSNYIKHSSQYEKQNTYMGLNNKLCSDPAYYCKLHQVYLSEYDVQIKKCLCKMSADMLSVGKCNSIIEFEQYQKELAESSRNRRKKNNYNIIATSTYKQTVKKILKEQQETSCEK